MTIREAIKQGAAMLRDNFPACPPSSHACPSFDESEKGTPAICRASPTPALDAEVLMAHTLQSARAALIAHGNDEASGASLSAFFRCIKRRQSGTPVAYITGVKEFFGLDFCVSPDVLIPKSDTELLTELAICYVKNRCKGSYCRSLPAAKGQVQNTASALCIADICTGSGCAGIALLYECGGCIASASFTDISFKALSIAKLNAARLLHGAFQTEFLSGDLLDVFPAERKFDLIISNPPYIPSGEVDLLLLDGRGEPRLALDGDAGGSLDDYNPQSNSESGGKFAGDSESAGIDGKGQSGQEGKCDGLKITRRLVNEAAKHLRRGGALIIESSEEGTKETAAMMAGAGLIKIKTHKDLAGQLRAAEGIMP